MLSAKQIVEFLNQLELERTRVSLSFCRLIEKFLVGMVINGFGHSGNRAL